MIRYYGHITKLNLKKRALEIGGNEWVAEKIGGLGGAAKENILIAIRSLLQAIQTHRTTIRDIIGALSSTAWLRQNVLPVLNPFAWVGR